MTRHVVSRFVMIWLDKMCKKCFTIDANTSGWWTSQTHWSMPTQTSLAKSHTNLSWYLPSATKTAYCRTKISVVVRTSMPICYLYLFLSRFSPLVLLLSFYFLLNFLKYDMQKIYRSFFSKIDWLDILPLKYSMYLICKFSSMFCRIFA